MDRLVGDLIPSAVQAAWGLSADDTASPLNGGGNRSVRVGDVVFKPVDDSVEATWCQECVSQLIPDRFRIAEPVRSLRGHWVESGWMASRWIAGVAGPDGHLVQLLETAARFHRALATVERPSFLGQRSHRWAAQPIVPHGAKSTWTGCRRRDPVRSCSMICGSPWTFRPK